ncbi:unnamed protein product [Adineta ricciae]|uniref:Uncharacterized protein n=1 Tax=Adineta ricciae TaxID=249248 RepID=A0A813QKB7_ADIRI|nr:unnamed protein product [Adineta ricciae]CAF0776177.1 unnamed protein product [Adineta ricciae]
MSPAKNEKPLAGPANTSAQIQRIFSEVQSQLPSVNFDDNDDDENDNDIPVVHINEEILDSNLLDNTDALLESLSNNHPIQFTIAQPRVETPQQPPTVEFQMCVSPNTVDDSVENQASPPKPSFLSMDIFNTIDFDKLPSSTSHPEHTTLTQTFHRPRPMNHHPSSQQQTTSKSRDDRQILERLAQQANKFNSAEQSRSTKEVDSFEDIESAIYAASHENIDRHGKRIRIPQSERKTIYIDLRNSNAPQQAKAQDEQLSTNQINPSSKSIQSSDSESEEDDNHNDGMLWFEKRQQARKQLLSQQPN